MDASCRELTSSSATGALGIVEILGDIDGAFGLLGINGVLVGEVGLRDICGIDQGVVARWSGRCVHIMPHGNPLIARRILERCCVVGITRVAEPEVVLSWPEADDEVEARVLEALGRARSPLAVEVLLSQVERWRKGGLGVVREGHGELLGHLVEQPMVVAVGARNIGKSTLTNALARRAVALVADAPGTTRDHVGVELVLDGLAVRWVDTPGFDGDGVGGGVGGDEIERQAQEAALELIKRADLVVHCGLGGKAGDGGELGEAVEGVPRVIRVQLQADLEREGGEGGFDVVTAAMVGEGLDELAKAVRRALVSDAALADPGRWRFW